MGEGPRLGRLRGDIAGFLRGRDPPHALADELGPLREERLHLARPQRVSVRSYGCHHSFSFRRLPDHRLPDVGHLTEHPNRGLGLGWWADGAAAPSDSERCGLPHEPVRVGEGPGIAAHREPVRSGAVGRDAGDLGEGTAV